MNLEMEAIRQLRQKTQAGMMDCRRALAESAGDGPTAEALLKTWGLAALEKRADREMKEGRVFIHSSGNSAAMVELACETDFVARSEPFRASGARIAELAWENSLSSPNAQLLGLISDLGAVLKENLAIKGLAYLGPKDSAFITSYLHGEDRIGVLLGARARGPGAFEDPRLLGFLHDLTLQIAAFRPSFVDAASLPQGAVEEKLSALRLEVTEDEALAGKAPKILEGIVQGRLRKYLVESSLLGHGFVRDEKRSVGAVLEELEREAAWGLKVTAFHCFAVGA